MAALWDSTHITFQNRFASPVTEFNSTETLLTMCVSYVMWNIARFVKRWICAQNALKGSISTLLTREASANQKSQ